MAVFFFFNDTATTEIYTLSLQTLFRSPPGARLGHRLCHHPLDHRVLDRLAVACPGDVLGLHPCDLFLRSEEHTSELQSQSNIVCRLLLEKKKTRTTRVKPPTCGTNRSPTTGSTGTINACSPPTTIPPY